MKSGFSLAVASSIIPLASGFLALSRPAVAAPPDTAPATLAGRMFLTVPGDEWRLSWHDEFDGNSLDLGKWAVGLPWKGDDGTNRHHNSQYASVIADQDISVHGGSLHLTTRRIETPNPRGGSYHFTEGLVTSSGKFSQAFGYFEMRAKLPTEAGPGTWPAFWLLTQGWPPEMDILEYWGSQNRLHQGTVTRGSDGKQHWDSYHRKNVSISGWHTFGLEWGPGYQIYNIDGVRTNSTFGAYLPTTPHYILLNSGIESARPPTASTSFPNDFVVDWVRVYIRPASTPALIDGSFEQEDASPWQLTGEASVVDYGSQSGQRCLRLDAAAETGASAKQTVYGLKPATRYTLTGFARTHGGKANLTVTEFGSIASTTASVSALPQTAAGGEEYTPLRVTFTTGSYATSAIVTCEAEPGATVFFDTIAIAAPDK